MNRKPMWLKIGVACAAAFVVPIAGRPVGHPLQSASAKVAACSAPGYHQFDFWIGDWDGFDVDKPTVVIARNHVDRILDSCVLREDYRSTDGMEGQSFSIYDASRKIWHQTWVTNRGNMLVIEGDFRGGEMVLSGTDHTADGKERRVRGVWKPEKDGVRETAVTSIDVGKTWQPWFDMVFHPRASADTGDAKLVAALDAEFQAAVKVNDAATMDRILADDYELVTGSGKTYTKSDLIDDARNGRTVLERNDELEKSVRVWGDTAVITAKLWEKGANAGKPFDHTLWFSDTYVRMPAGWKYVFGQSSLPLPKTP